MRRDDNMRLCAALYAGFQAKVSNWTNWDAVNKFWVRRKNDRARDMELDVMQIKIDEA